MDFSNNFKIRTALKTDINSVEQIYFDILEKEEKSVSYTNWQKGLYPTRKDAEKALFDGTLFVGEIGKTLVGCVNLNSIQPPEYKKINWTISAEPSEILVIHTLCISPAFAGRKLGHSFVNFIEEYAKINNFKVIRLDTYIGNIPAANLYTKLGYTYVGSTDFLFQGVIHEVLKCFEKII